MATKTFGALKLTAKGLETQLEMQTGEALQITRAVIGDGVLMDGISIINLTGLINEIPSHQNGSSEANAKVDIIYNQVQDGAVLLKVRIQSGDTEFYLREVGLMALDSDGKEFLYAYTNCNDGLYFSVENDNRIIRDFTLATVVSNTELITVKVTLPEEITKEEFGGEIKKLYGMQRYSDTKLIDTGKTWVNNNPVYRIAFDVNLTANSDGIFKYTAYDDPNYPSDIKKVIGDLGGHLFYCKVEDVVSNYVITTKGVKTIDIKTNYDTHNDDDPNKYFWFDRSEYPECIAPGGFLKGYQLNSVFVLYNGYIIVREIDLHGYNLNAWGYIEFTTSRDNIKSGGV